MLKYEFTFISKGTNKKIIFAQCQKYQKIKSSMNVLSINVLCIKRNFKKMPILTKGLRLNKIFFSKLKSDIMIGSTQNPKKIKFLVLCLWSKVWLVRTESPLRNLLLDFLLGEKLLLKENLKVNTVKK